MFFSQILNFPIVWAEFEPTVTFRVWIHQILPRKGFLLHLTQERLQVWRRSDFPSFPRQRMYRQGGRNDLYRQSGKGAPRLSVPRTASVSWYVTSFPRILPSLPDATVRLRRARPSGRSGPGYSSAVSWPGHVPSAGS